MKFSCISDALLADYIGNILIEKEKKNISSHLAVCDYCRDRYENVSALLKETDIGEYQPVSGHAAAEIMKILSSLIIEQDELSLGKSPAIIKKSPKFLDKIKPFFPWIETKIAVNSLPLQFAMVAVRSNALPVEQVSYISISKKLGDLNSEICLQKVSGNRFRIHARLLDCDDKSARLTLIKDENPIASHLINLKFGFLGVLSYGNYLVKLNNNNWLFKISKTGVYEDESLS